MKILSAIIFKLCTVNGIHNEEAVLTCFDKYVNCSITQAVTDAKDTEQKAIIQLNKCMKTKG
jgi:hypothetical protein